MPSAKLARRAVPFQRRLVNRSRGNRAADSFDAATPLAQQMIKGVFGASRGRHHDGVGADRARPHRLIDVDDFHFPAVDVFDRVIGNHFDFRLVEVGQNPVQINFGRCLHADHRPFCQQPDFASELC